MENCLVTKLKGSVNNNAIPKIGELLMFGVETTTPHLKATEPITVTGLNGTKLKAYGTDVEVTSLSGVDTRFTTIPSTNANISIDNKYALIWLTNITDADGDIISDLKYMPSLVQVSIGFKGSVSFKEFISNIPNVTTLTMYGNKKTYYDGTLANMLVMRNLTSMTSLDWKTTYPVYTDGIGYEFDIEDIGKILPDSITTFRTSNGMTVGPLESFVAGLRTNRTTGSMSIYIVNAQYTGWRLITFQGNIIPTSSSAHTLSWTASTITFDGTTIDA